MRTRPLCALLLLLLGLVPGCSFLSTTPIGRVLDLAREGEEKQLRTPMRPARGAPRVLVFALDGVGPDELRAALAAGALPVLSSVLGEEREPGLYAHAYRARGALSVLPSMTFAGWTAVFTGEPPARNGVPGNEWFDRRERRFYAPAPATVPQQRHTLEVHTDQLLGGVIQVPTLFERADVRSYVALGMVHRGADLLIVPDPTDLGDMVRAGVKGAVGGWDPGQRAYGKVDRSGAEDFAEAVAERGVPDLGVVYFPGIDLFTHTAEPPLQEMEGYLAKVVNPAVEEVLEAYRRAGALEGSWIVLVSDHGQTPVLADDRHALGTTGEDEPPHLLRQAGFRVRAFKLETEGAEEDYQAVVAYNGFLASLYLADRSTCPTAGARCDWARPPRLAEDVLPVVRAYDRANRTGEGLPALRGTLDLILARVPGEGLRVWNGERLVAVGEYLRANPRPDLPALEARLRGLGEGPHADRAGDVLLLAKAGLERPIGERFYFGPEYHSMHGSPGAQDSRILLLVARPGSTGAMVRERVRGAVGETPSQLDVTPLVLELLGKR